MGNATTADEVWGGLVVHDEWRVVDQWWTENPVSREYRDVTRNGRRRTEVRSAATVWQWQEAPGA